VIRNELFALLLRFETGYSVLSCEAAIESIYTKPAVYPEGLRISIAPELADGLRA
jgi:hypothetical protein